MEERRRWKEYNEVGGERVAPSLPPSLSHTPHLTQQQHRPPSLR